VRPVKAYRLVNKAFKPFYRHQDTLYPALSSFKNKQVAEAISKMLEMCIKSDIENAKDCSIEYEPIQSYYENCLSSESSVCGQMFYISDKWNCTGRLKFLKRVLELY